jgi:hypothetical protein
MESSGDSYVGSILGNSRLGIQALNLQDGPVWPSPVGGTAGVMMSQLTAFFLNAFS